MKGRRVGEGADEERRWFLTIHQPQGSNTTPAPIKRKNTKSNGVKLPLADARAMTMKDDQIKIVTTAAMMPTVSGEKRAVFTAGTDEDGLDDIPLLSRHGIIAL